MRVLVTGASGFLGANLVRHLLSEGYSVRALARSEAKAAPLVQQGAEVVIGEITDHRALLEAFGDAELVFHLAGRLFIPGISTDSYYRTHVGGTATLISCCFEQSRLPRFVHCSTTGVLGPTGDNPADEQAPIAPTNAYEDSKWRAELLVREAMQRGLLATIVRPGLVYGPGDLHLLGFFRTIQRGLFRPIGARPVWLHPILIDDMSDALIRCALHPRAIEECFHIANPEPVTIAALAATIASALGVIPPRGSIPMPVARFLALLGDVLPGPLKPLAPMTSSRLDFLTHSRVYDVGKVQRLLGFTARTDLATGIAATVAWYRQHGHLAGREKVATAVQR